MRGEVRMYPFFNISSRGGSATMWLAKILNSHPLCFCIHSVEPESNPYTHPPSPELEIQKLAALREQDTSKSGPGTFGIIHRFYDTAPKTDFLKAGGSFSAIVRHPFKRISSLFVHHFNESKILSGIPLLKGLSVYETLKESGWITDPDDAPILMAQKEPHTHAEDLFKSICSQVLHHDMDIIQNGFDQNNIIRFEDMTSDSSHCLNWLEGVLGFRDKILVKCVEREFNNPYNIHAGLNQVSTAQLFAAWPETFKKIFFSVVISLDYEQVLTAYKGVDYEFSPEALAWVETAVALESHRQQIFSR